MQSRLLVLISMSAVVFGSTAPEVWNNKNFAAWTDKDAHQIMDNSPWAKERPMPISERPGVVELDSAGNASSPNTAALGNSANTVSSPNLNSTSAGGTGSAERNSQTPTRSLGTAPIGAPQTQPILKIVWASALPVRLAVLKLRATQSEPTADEIANTEKDWKNYVIAVVGLPAPEGGSDPKALASGASLRLHGKQPAISSNSDYRRIGSSDVYFFSFSKVALPITASDGDVEFKLKTGRMSFSQKFHLAGMQYQGRLAL